MKLKFEKLDFQSEAVDAIANIFEGQSIKQSNFSVAPVLRDNPDQIYYDDEGNIIQDNNKYDLGIGNKLDITNDEILDNIKEIQLFNGLAPTKNLKEGDYHFCIEMETGTGKTYVYLKTIFELNKKYGFIKFIIVVPSIAVKEGTHKSLQITEEHFKSLYDNAIYDYFAYDSQKLEQVRNFATSDNIQIMIINIDAFKKSFTDPTKENKANIIHRTNDRLSGYKPIEYIQETNPIVIIDEPQSVDTTPKSKQAIASLNPLCTLRYSATHKEKMNLMYKLDSVDAYERKLVKQIEVANISAKDNHNKAYIKLISVDNKKSPIKAKVELDILKNGKTTRVQKTVKQGDDLFDVSGGREIYCGYIINDIYCEKGSEYIDFTSKPDIIRLGHSIGNVDDDEIKRMQIRKTIEEHLNKELRLQKEGIKVLSLFFIDKVANYRYYNEEGNPQNGKYALMFEEEYKRLIRKPKYNTLFKDVDIETEVEVVHNGYFAQDKKGKLKDTKGNSLADEDVYSLIMKDKEKLLSFTSKLKFIFSHSALKEGWDNPNVFQICTLNETRSEMKKRQEIGRGLRLAVDQNGERKYGHEINTLTVMANESYEDFAKALQKEIAEEEGIKFGVIEKHTFANIARKKEDGNYEYLGQKSSETIWSDLKEKGYIDKDGKVTDELKRDLRDNKVQVAEEFKESKDKIVSILKKVAGNLNIKDADKRKEIELNKGIFLGEDFKKLWDKIKYKTTYSVEFDTDNLIEKCSDEIKRNLRVDKAKLIYEKGLQRISAAGVDTKEIARQSLTYEAKDYVIPDILTYLQNETNLTRKTIVEILKKSDRLQDFKNNPQKFMDEVSFIIKNQMRHLIVDGIKYEKIGDEEYYSQELFEDKELKGYLNDNMIKSEKSVYKYIVYDSTNEMNFAQRFEDNESVKVYAKLPDWFKIDTPLGTYNPDWAVLVDKDGEEKLYFVLETKANILWEALRPIEDAKIRCGEKHFEALGNTVEFKKVDDFNNFIESV